MRPSDPPYKFLSYFEEPDQGRFSGREDEVQEVLAGLTRGRTFVLYGRSGLGKTSLLLAGLFPRLRQRGFLPLRIRLLESPVDDICAALAAALPGSGLTGENAPRAPEERVQRMLEELSTRAPLVIVLDQFEEFFVRFRERPAARAELMRLLGRISQEHATNLRLVFSLREDYYAELQDLRATLPELTRYGLRLLPLTAYGARQAIVRPLQHAHVTYEEAFVNHLVDLLAGWNFDPPVLQIVCTELYRDVVARRGLPVHLTREDLERLGGVDGILGGYVHRVTSGLGEKRMLLVRLVLDALISSERTRYALRVEDLLAGPVRAEQGEVRAVLEHLTGQGLLRVEHRKGEEWFELLHEHLITIASSWLSDDEDFVRFRATRNFVATLSEGSQWRTNPDWLLTAPQLEDRVDPWKERLRLDEKQAEFLLRSSVHGQADSVAYWAARYDESGEGRSVRLVLGLLEHPDLSVRRGAAGSCGKLRDGSGQLAARCLTLALEDPDEVVRGAARKSFVQLAKPDALGRLQGALEAARQRPLALELLADLLEAERPAEGVAEHWSRLARNIVRERRLRREQVTIRARIITGAQVGVVSGLAWSLTLGLLIATYWLYTNYPEVVTVRWPTVFEGQVLWLIIDNLPFVFVPWGLILGWRVARRAAITAAAEGREDWRASVLRSGTLIIGCVVLHLVVLITEEAATLLNQEAEVARLLGISRWLVFLTVLLVASLLEWLLTVGLVQLGVRCFRAKSKPATVYAFAVLCGAVFPHTLDWFLSMWAWWAHPWPGALHMLFASTVASVSIVSNYQTFVIISVLAAERLRRPSTRPRETLAARAVVLVCALIFFLIYPPFREVETLPGVRGDFQLVTEVPLTGQVRQNEKNAEYFSVDALSDRPFALSIHAEKYSRTRLVIGGQELSSGMLLVSAWPRLAGAVVSLPGLDEPKTGSSRQPILTDYGYQLRREPIQQGHLEEARRGEWSLAMLPLEQVASGAGEGPAWRVSLGGRLPPALRDAIQGVYVLPVLVNIAGLEPGACMGISSSAGPARKYMDTVVITNRADTGVVPPPGIQMELFAEGLRLWPGADGSWSATLTLSPIVEFRPLECEQPSVGPLPGGDWRLPVPKLYGERPSLLVAVMLY
ncbi:MAG TPA: hypothetical protein VFZ09_08700 [Archangium sp.]|uniref:nSTAND1 domain-containing NTPase n=1 Tax=Archangium sp. TaxID=1872627 RepID=UPI002E37AB2D|nr:hypothetical protein [Archangium sp.]HEX5746310.1 hypothetical protein [Archangium sp.]